jgi:hypothetical protein
VHAAGFAEVNAAVAVIVTAVPAAGPGGRDVIEPGDEAALIDADVRGANGVRLGSVSEIYRDDVSQRPEWVTVDLGGDRRFVPLREGELVDGEVRVPYSAEVVAGAPAYDPDAGQLREQDEAALYEHYGLPHALPFDQGR